MQIEVNELEPCKLAVHYEANALEIMDKRSEVQNAFKNAPVPGNRPGKASIEVIKIHYRQQIEESLKRALAEDAYHNTIFDKKLRPHGAPRFNNMLLDGGKFVCEFEISTKPDFVIPEWKTFELPQPHNQMVESEIAELMLQELRVRFGETEPYGDTDFIQNGDNVILDYKGSIDGVDIPQLCAEAEMVPIGKGQLQGFDTNLLGMQCGETREFDFIIPENTLPSMAGKTAHFTATLTTGSKNRPCPLNDELAVKMG